MTRTRFLLLLLLAAACLPPGRVVEQPPPASGLVRAAHPDADRPAVPPVEVEVFASRTPDGPGPAPGPADLPVSTRLPLPWGPGRLAVTPRGPVEPVAPHAERLPYHPNAPPAAR